MSKSKLFTLVLAFVVLASTFAFVGSASVLHSPKNLKAVRTSDTTVQLSWSASAGASGYEVYRSTVAASGFKKVTTVTKATFQDTKLVSSNTYYYKIRAYKKSGSSTSYSAYTAVVSAVPVAPPANASAVYAGYSRRDITPPFPAAIQGQFALRIANKAVTPIYASAMVMETRKGTKQTALSVWVSVDLSIGDENLQDAVAKKVAYLGIKPENVFVSATHTHDSIFLRYNPCELYHPSSVGSLGFPTNRKNMYTPPQNLEFVAQKAADAIAQAWKERVQVSVGAGKGSAAIGHCRYVLKNKYVKDGSGKWVLSEVINYMGGNTRSSINGDTKEEFIGFTGVDGDNTVEVIGFWDKSNKLIGMVAGIHAPAQASDNDNFISADIWGYVRTYLSQKLGMKDVPLVPLCMFAGDVGVYDPVAGKRYSPDYNAKIVSDGIVEGLANAKKKLNASPVLAHKKFYLDVPVWDVTQAEYDEAVAFVFSNPPDWARLNADGIIDRYKLTHVQNVKTLKQSYQVVRLGDIILCTAPYEMFLNYGEDIRNALKTKYTDILPIQLTGGHYGYLPNELAVEHPSYGVGPANGTTGPEGGHFIVKELVKEMSAMKSLKN